MADKRKAMGGGPLTHTLHVWPTDELIAQSAYWPAWWYQAYERSARRLADGVACCILGGLPDCPEPIRMDLQPSGSLTFSVHLWGTTIEVFIWHFEGPDDPEPDAPGPNGGVRRHTADGLVLGLRGTGKEFSTAPFYDGLVPSVPVGRGGRLWPWTVRITAASWVAAKPRMAAAKATRESDSQRTASVLPVRSVTGGANCFSASSPRKAPAITLPTGTKVEMRRSPWMGATRRQVRASTRFDGLGFEPSPSNRPLVFPHPINRTPIAAPRSCLETPRIAEATDLRLN